MASLDEPAVQLELDLDAPEVALQQLVSAAGSFAGLIREVARTYLGTTEEPVRWIVDVQEGSIRLPVRPKPTLEKVSSSALPEVVAVIAEGLAVLDRTPERPPFFTDKALEQAKALSNLASAEFPLAVRNGKAKLPLTRRIAAHVDDVLGAPESSYGTIEGRLEAFNIHGAAKTFGVYDFLTGERVECRLTDKVTVDDLGPAIGKRVAVRGQIVSRPSGERVRIEAEELEVFPAEDDLPSLDEVTGILKGY